MVVEFDLPPCVCRAAPAHCTPKCKEGAVLVPHVSAASILKYSTQRHRLAISALLAWVGAKPRGEGLPAFLCKAGFAGRPMGGQAAPLSPGMHLRVYKGLGFTLCSGPCAQGLCACVTVSPPGFRRSSSVCHQPPHADVRQTWPFMCGGPI